jgi:hypothetical protein
MPTYISNSPYDLIFGDLHYGVNAFVDGVTDRDGQAVVLGLGEIIDVPEGINHAFLIEQDADFNLPNKKVKPSRGDVTVSEETLTVTDSVTK